MNATEKIESGSGGPLGLFSGSIAGTLIRLGGLALIDSFALWFVYRLVNDSSLILATLIVLITVGINAAFLSDKLYPFRWFSPGLALMALMVAYPTLFTVYTAFTNYSTGNLLTRPKVLDLIEEKPEYRYLPEGEQYYDATPYRNADGKYLLWLVGRDDKQVLIAPEGEKSYQPTPVITGMEGVTVLDEGSVPPISVEGYTYLEPDQLSTEFADGSEVTFGYPLNAVSVTTITESTAPAEGGYLFDPAQDLVVDYGGSSPKSYQAYVFKSSDGNYVFWLQPEKGDAVLARTDGPVVINGVPQSIEGYDILSNRERTAVTKDLPGLSFGNPDDPLYVDAFSATRAGRFRQRYVYSDSEDAFIDQVTGAKYTVKEGTFTLVPGSVDADVAAELDQQLSPGYYVVTGFDHFKRLFTDERLRGPFIRIFLWTVAHAFLSVVITFSLGLGLAILMNDTIIPQRKLLRSLILIPYAIPAFISTLVWRGLLNPRLGLINHTLEKILGEGNGPGWYSSPMWAKVGILLIQLWLGFPYMMLICTGALQALPSDIYEAAEVDGASSWQRFRSITLPLLLVAVGPLLIASFAYNFNNFTVIELFNEGNPPIANSSVPAGHTDILITYTYAQAFGSGGGTDYAFASAISIFIFMIVAAITIFNFRFTRAWEETSQNV